MWVITASTFADISTGDGAPDFGWRNFDRFDLPGAKILNYDNYQDLKQGNKKLLIEPIKDTDLTAT
jgi:hypothetical protein